MGFSDNLSKAVWKWRTDVTKPTTMISQQNNHQYVVNTQIKFILLFDVMHQRSTYPQVYSGITNSISWMHSKYFSDINISIETVWKIQYNYLVWVVGYKELTDTVGLQQDSKAMNRSIIVPYNEGIDCPIRISLSQYFIP